MADEAGQDQGGEGDQRLSSLEKRLQDTHHAEAIRTGKATQTPSKGYSQGNRVLAELIGGLVGGAIIGWSIDSLFDTGPWALLVMMMLGIAAAFRNIIRISQEHPE
ncbi:AtpZ/AtpI family protein [Aquisediminimonas sediminicola]|uniref:AtpZ/AtpI family protein n=1 Tax=Alteraquisediminimonas sediminicola TaxID=2676787 RepID=UPI001C8D48CC|nr:AtpZ/AtpI family protein [Aquisediminimonas sediminicola]